MEVSLSSSAVTVPAQSATALTLHRGARLRIVAIEAEQVADLAIFACADVAEGFSPGRTMDYNERIVPQRGDVLYSNRSSPLAVIVDDTVGVHDLLLAPCSREMFARRGEMDHPSCHENLSLALKSFGVTEDTVASTLNVFMNVRCEGNEVRLLPPPVRPHDYFEIEAKTDLVVGIAACSSELTNNGSCKPVAYSVRSSQ